MLFTTGTRDAHALLAGSLPRRVLLRHAPFENAASIGMFLKHWRPQVGVFVESPGWPLLVEMAGAAGLRLALLNARLGSRWFRSNFHRRQGRAMMARVLSRFTLIVPQSDVVRGRAGAAATLGRLRARVCLSAHSTPTGLEKAPALP